MVRRRTRFLKAQGSYLRHVKAHASGDKEADWEIRMKIVADQGDHLSC